MIRSATVCYIRATSEALFSLIRHVFRFSYYTFKLSLLYVNIVSFFETQTSVCTFETIVSLKVLVKISSVTESKLILKGT